MRTKSGRMGLPYGDGHYFKERFGCEVEPVGGGTKLGRWLRSDPPAGWRVPLAGLWKDGSGSAYAVLFAPAGRDSELVMSLGSWLGCKGAELVEFTRLPAGLLPEGRSLAAIAVSPAR